jgi:hypothetical protein
MEQEARLVTRDEYAIARAHDLSARRATRLASPRHAHLARPRQAVRRARARHPAVACRNDRGIGRVGDAFGGRARRRGERNDGHREAERKEQEEGAHDITDHSERHAVAARVVHALPVDTRHPVIARLHDGGRAGDAGVAGRSGGREERDASGREGEHEDEKDCTHVDSPTWRACMAFAALQPVAHARCLRGLTASISYATSTRPRASLARGSLRAARPAIGTTRTGSRSRCAPSRPPRAGATSATKPGPRRR